MDNAYKFGRIEVSCEGFSHPDDAYILKGSCGLEYSLELTEEGKRRHKGGSHGSTGGWLVHSVVKCFTTLWDGKQ